jgi:hypothetical protein
MLLINDLIGPELIHSQFLIWNQPAKYLHQSININQIYKQCHPFYESQYAVYLWTICYIIESKQRSSNEYEEMLLINVMSNNNPYNQSIIILILIIPVANLYVQK